MGEARRRGTREERVSQAIAEGRGKDVPHGRTPQRRRAPSSMALATAVALSYVAAQATPRRLSPNAELRGLSASDGPA